MRITRVPAIYAGSPHVFLFCVPGKVLCLAVTICMFYKFKYSNHRVKVITSLTQVNPKKPKKILRLLFKWEIFIEKEHACIVLKLNGKKVEVFFSLRLTYLLPPCSLNTS